MPLPIIARALAGIAGAGRMAAAKGAAGAAAAMRLKVRVDATKALRKFDKIEEIPEDLLEEGFDVFYEETPVRSGNARRNTKFDKRKKKIHADYPYAQRLDDGWSKQSPRGMSEPAQKAMGKYAKQVTMKINKE
jgi:hypothetical protein